MLASRFLEAPLTRALVGMPFDVADASRLDGLADIDGLLARFERRIVEARQTGEAAAELVQRLRSGQETSSPSERSAAIEVLMATERSLADALRRIKAKATENEDLARAHAPPLLPYFRRITALIEEELLIYLEAARDVRWEVLAEEAAAEAPAEGPVLSMPDDVDELFRSLPPVS